MDFVADVEFSVLLLIEVATIIFLIFYIIFAAVVIKQVKIMTETLEVGFEGAVKLLAFMHFVFALCALFVSIIVFFII